MDPFKFAFETTIVGVLAFPWLAPVASIFLPKLPLNKGERDGTPASLVSKILEPAALSVLVLAAAYFMGSAISPVATQLLDHPDMPTLKIREIRAEVYKMYSGWQRDRRVLRKHKLCSACLPHTIVRSAIPEY